MSCFIPLHLVPLKQSLSLTLELSWWQEIPVIPLSPLPCSARITGSYIVIPNIHVDVANLKAYSYTASTHTAIFPALQCGLLTLYLGWLFKVRRSSYGHKP